LGGNIGQSLLGELERIVSDDLIVLELSSFQLEDAADLKWSPPLSLLTNASPNHLDRHVTFEDYVACKLNICRFQKAGDCVVLGACDDALAARVRQIADHTGARVVHASDDVPASLRVPGRHNCLNAALAWAAADRLGASTRAIRGALESFSGLPHRLQFVAAVDGVRYFNDSKATTPGGVAVALQSFDRPVILITGGQSKEASWAPVQGLLADRVKQCICTGQNRRELACQLGGHEAGSLTEALTTARNAAGEGDVILFSPGSPSYDQYVNYEARGEAFVRAVRSPSGVSA
jgi:UDP-N-acetylmuramoylalanine--D-glutamate ligase